MTIKKNMKIRKGDNVKILKGKDSGKTGKVLHVMVETGKVVIEGLNLKYKHMRARKQGETGQRIMFPAPLSISSIMLVCPKCGKPSRVGFKVAEKKGEVKKERKTRICKKCNNNI